MYKWMYKVLIYPFIFSGWFSFYLSCDLHYFKRLHEVKTSTNYIYVYIGEFFYMLQLVIYWDCMELLDN
jgi:hypothetical protein